MWVLGWIVISIASAAVLAMVCANCPLLDIDEPEPIDLDEVDRAMCDCDMAEMYGAHKTSANDTTTGDPR